jgi:hypothetical protein
MSPKSKTRGLVQFETVLKPKESFLTERDAVLEKETEHYFVENHMIFTVKSIGDFLVCDDKDAVSIINPNNMKLKTNIPVPKENCYL